jgi:hypothetical protein
MYTDSRKIHIIEAVLKVEDEQTLSQIERAIQLSKPHGKRTSAHDFVGTLSKEDAALIEKAVQEDCEQIHPDDWK